MNEGENVIIFDPLGELQKLADEVKTLRKEDTSSKGKSND